MLSFPNCKINVGLYITNRRHDGYHDLETVFAPVKGLYDSLEVTPSATGTTRLLLDGLNIAGTMEQNLVWKAYELLRAQYPAKVPVLDIHLLKAIPMGSGVGGGSADGAFMLRLLNDYCRLELEDTMLLTMALQLGSDCPFFIYNIPCYATGRGEQLRPVELPQLTNLSIQLVCPQVHISTKAAFGMITPRKANFDLATLPKLPLHLWKEHVSNDFEAPAFMQHSGLAAIKRQLYEQGAIYASMTGSGSAIYGIFERGKKADIQSEIAYTEHYSDIG